MPFVHSLARTGPNHYRTDKPPREVCNKPATSKRPKYGGPGSDHNQWQKDSARHKKQERAWVVDMLLAGFGIAQLVCHPEQDYEPTINLHYKSLQDARRSIEGRQAAEWRRDPRRYLVRWRGIGAGGMSQWIIGTTIMTQQQRAEKEADDLIKWSAGYSRNSLTRKPPWYKDSHGACPDLSVDRAGCRKWIVAALLPRYAVEIDVPEDHPVPYMVRLEQDQ